MSEPEKPEEKQDPMRVVCDVRTVKGQEPRYPWRDEK